jgi:aspartate racemase
LSSSFKDRPDLVGVLGGMGPLATVDFVAKLIAATPAERDEDHVPIVVSSCPQLPSRVAPILDPGARSPLPELKERLAFLLGAGARLIVMPCNTAHHWHGELAAAAKPVPFLHIADAAIDEVVRRGAKGAVGLLATEGTLKSGFYQRRLAARGFTCVLPDDGINRALVLPGIAHVKANRLADAARLFRDAVARLERDGAVTVILGCTEIPAAFPADDPWLSAHAVDANEALARATVAWALAARGSAQTSKSRPRAR